MGTPAAIPDLREELNRKTFEAVEWLTYAVELGHISEPQFSTAIDAVWMVAAGLVDDSFKDIVTETDRITRGIGAHRLRRHFIRGDTVITASWTAGESCWYYRQCVGGNNNADGMKDAANPAVARDAMQAFCQKLLNNGYVEL